MAGDVVYKNILGNMSDGVMTIDLDGLVMTFNQAAERILGMKSDEVLGTPFGQVFLMLEGNDDFNQVVLDAIYESESIHRKVVDFHVGDKIMALEMTTSFLQEEVDGEKKKIAVIVVFNDITEVNKLRDAEKQLTQELKDNHKMLQDAYMEIEESNENLNSLLKKVQVARVVTTFFVIFLFVGIGVYSWNPKSAFGNKSSGRATAKSAGPQEITTVEVVPRMVSSSIMLSGELEPLEVISIRELRGRLNHGL